MVIVNSFLKALDGWVPSCAFYPVPRRKCKLAAFAKRTIILYFFLRTSSRPEIEVVNHFWARCCGRVAQSRLHSASEKNGAGKALFKTPQFCMIEIAAHQGHKKKSVPGRCGPIAIVVSWKPFWKLVWSRWSSMWKLSPLVPPPFIYRPSS